MVFSENLKTVRKLRNISQEQLAELLGVSRQAVSKWEQGIGYPETDKLLIIAKELNISLDYLLLDKNGPIEHEETQTNVIVPSGTISIKTHDGLSVIVCHKVNVSKMLIPSKSEPRYSLNGINGVSFWGENSTTLGWYATEEDVKKEVDEISNAIRQGEQSYDLKYYAKVKFGVVGVKLCDQ